MALLVTVFAAVASVIVWYFKKKANQKDPYKTVALVYMFSGASLMWLVDLIVKYVKEGAKVFMPENVYDAAGNLDMAATIANQQNFFYNAMNDLALGLSCVALGLVIYAVILVIADPKKVLWKKGK